jgi:hypothetical protein
MRLRSRPDPLIGGQWPSETHNGSQRTLDYFNGQIAQISVS